MDGRRRSEAHLGDGQREVNLLLPLQLEGRFGNSQTAAAATSHTYIGVSVDKYPVGPLALSAGYSTSNNDVDAEKWWINDKWTADQVDTMSFGVDYTLRGFFGADVDTGYEYKLVRRNGDVDGTARNTFRASLIRSCGAVRRGWPAKVSWSPAAARTRSVPAPISRLS